MENSINYLADNQIVQVKFNGRMNFKTAEQYSKDAIKLAHEHNCSKFILDHSEADHSVNIHSTGEELQQFGFKISDKIAIVVKEGHNSESASHNSRWCDSKYFRNIKEAIKWLVEIKQ